MSSLGSITLLSSLISYVLIFICFLWWQLETWGWEALDSGEQENREEEISWWEKHGRKWAAEEKWKELSPTEYLTGSSHSTCVNQKHLVPYSYLFFFPSSIAIWHTFWFPPRLLSFSFHFSFPHTFLSSESNLTLFCQLYLLNISQIHSLSAVLPILSTPPLYHAWTMR